MNIASLNFKWYVLSLAAITTGLVLSMPEMCMAVLFTEISEELDLNLVQIGTIWGIVPLGSVAFLIVGGVICDHFGVKRTISVACILVGIIGAVRGISDGYVSLLVVSFFFGLLGALIPVSVIKANSIWFPSRQLGFANSVTAMGFGVGAAVSSLVSATYLSPVLGSWRNVLFLYGAVSVAFGILWFLTIKEPQDNRKVNLKTTVQVRESISHILHIKPVWLIGLTVFAYMGSVRAIDGYLPLYLRENGWLAIYADGTLTALNIVGTIAVIPIALLSDRFGIRKGMLVPAILIATVCAGLLPIVSNAFLWGILIIFGIFRSAYQSLANTMCVETEGVGARYSGMAAGLIYTFHRVGFFIAPPLGNSLASVGLGMPFVFWAGLFFIGALILIFFVKETGWKVKRTTYNQTY